MINMTTWIKSNQIILSTVINKINNILVIIAMNMILYKLLKYIQKI